MDVDKKSDSPSRTLKTISCPSCGAAIPLRALGQSIVVACASCAAELDISRPEIRVISKYKEVLAELPLPLGARGKVHDQLYEVIGALERSQSGYEWLEYLLFNPHIGFRWLVCDDDHWSFGEPVKDISAIQPKGDHMRYQGERYRLFNRGPAMIERVVGEFYWRATVGSGANCTDYIAPPRMLSKEHSGKDTNWTLLHYVEYTEIEEAFGVSLSKPSSAGAIQPNPNSKILHGLRRIIAVAVIAAMGIQVTTAVVARSQEVLKERMESQQVGTHEERVFGPFTLTANRSLNELEVSSNLDNQWVELDCLLTNEETGQTYDFSNAVEYYSGRDSDGAWSEGSQSKTSLLSNIPAGRYTLTVSALDDPFLGPHRAVWLYLKHDVTPWKNFLIAGAAILLYPVFLLYRRRSFEQRRWYDSPFDIYSQATEE